MLPFTIFSGGPMADIWDGATRLTFELLAEAEPAMIFVSDRRGVIRYVNASAVKRFGRPATDIVGRTQGELFPPEIAARHTQAVERVMATGAEFRGEERDFDDTWLETILVPIGVGSESTGVLGISRDVTARHRALEAEEARRRDKEVFDARLRQSEKLEALGQLAGGIAHDFNNQLTAIVGFSDLLVARIDDPKLRRYAEASLESARRSAALVRQLLTFARRSPFAVSRFDMNQELGGVVSLLERSIDKRIAITLNLRAQRAWLEGDASLLQNAILNLALNARDAMPHGGTLGIGTDDVTVEPGHAGAHPRELLPGQYVRISVKDTGCGMDEAVQQRLFEPFFTTKEPGRGTGLGLAAVFGTVQRHGGAVAVESELGRGTTVRVYLPEVSPIAPQTVAEAARVSLRPHRILIVDDEPLIRELAVEVVRGLGHSAVACENGRLAVEAFESHPADVDVVVLDIVMPEMDGLQAFAAIRAVRPTMPILLMSGYGTDSRVSRVLEQDLVGFLAKPFSREELVVGLARLLEP